MPEQWFITGGCGFAGSNLASALLADGIHVVVFDNLSRLGSAQNLDWLREQADRPGAGVLTFLYGDVRNRGDVDEAFERHGRSTQVVAHLAGQVAMTTSVARPRLDFEVNALGTIHMLEAIRRLAPHAAVLYSSTNKVYGDLAHLEYVETATRWTVPAWPNGFDESLPLDFSTPYGCSKGAADQYVLDYHATYGLKTVVFRHSSIYGGRQFATYDQGWVGWFCREALRQERELREQGRAAPTEISGDGKQVRDLLHVDDFVRIYRAAAEGIERAQGEAFNIGGGIERSRSLLELFADLERSLSIPMRIVSRERRHADQLVFVANGGRAEARIGSAPRVPVPVGLLSSINWSRETEATNK